MGSVRRPAVAGSFYPADRTVLSGVLDELLGRARQSLPDARGPVPKAVIVPHAGYVYSGQTAARAYARLEPGRGQVERVVLLGPAHRAAVEGLALPEDDLLATPLGELEVDARAGSRIEALDQVVVSRRAHAMEHSLEVQLPFIQVVLGQVRVVPLAVGRATGTQVAQVIDALWGGPETVVVISTDLSHYLPQDEAVALDESTVAQVLGLRAQVSHSQACGATPLNGMLEVAAARSMRAELLDRCTSADTAGSPERVVGYCAVALHEPAGAGQGRAADPVHEPEAWDGEVLLDLAQRAIAQAVGVDPPPLEAVPGELPWLTRPGASFVTLRKDGRLRGCIGSVTAHRPLGEDVVANAVLAATGDPRFEPVGPEELGSVSLEVSVLSAPETVEASEEAEVRARLRPGVDGVILSLGGRRATFLPQVWEELGDPAVFLARLKRKAGLPEDFWHEGLVIQTYRVRAWTRP